MTTLTAPSPATVYPTLPTDHPWPEQGHWTYDDFLRLPDDGVRYEIIEGVLYMTNAPDSDHQYAVHQIAVEFELYARKTKAGSAWTAPFEVHLPGIAEPVQPDVFFVADERREIIRRKFVEGAPDLVVEVTSPSTGRADRKVKFDAYERAGVREFWIVNPKMRSVQVWALARGEYALRGEYGPGEKVSSDVLPDLDLLTDSLFMPQ